MITLDELNDLRSREKWEDIAESCREHLHHEQEAYVLRGFAQALEKIDQKTEEYEGALLRLLELKDREADSAYRLAQYYKDQNETEEAVRHLQIAIRASLEEDHYDQVEYYWLELVELAPGELPFYLEVADKVNESKHHHRAAVLLQTLLPIYEKREDWPKLFSLLKKILKYTPSDASLREPIVNTMEFLYPDSEFLPKVLDYTKIKEDRDLPEAFQETELFLGFLPDNYVQHPDWGVGRVKDLNMDTRKVKINFQRKRNHTMALELATRAVDLLDANDFRVLRVVDRENLIQTMKEDSVKFVKILLKSFGYSLNAKDIKPYVVPDLMPLRNWNSWWTSANAALRKDPFISITGTSTKTYILRETETSDEEELLKRFDETRTVHDKVDQIYGYLRMTKKEDIQEHVVHHFSQKLLAMAPARRSHAERVELWFTNEDLKPYKKEIESFPYEIIENAITNEQEALKIISKLRIKSHQVKCSLQVKELFPETWKTIFKDMLLSPDVSIRDELSKTLEKNDGSDVLNDVIDLTLNDFRQYSYVFIWLAGKALVGTKDWLNGKITIGVIVDRLLLLVDYLTSQAKRRDKEEAVWLRKVASDAREIIRKNNYMYFKQNIQEMDESMAQSIYRRAQANEGLDSHTSMDLTTIVRARFPHLFETKAEEETLIPEGIMCLPSILIEKKRLIKHWIEVDMPEVVQEIETARQHGDLRENAEYHAAKDKQKLLASQVAELQDQLTSPVAVRIDQFRSDRIAFGSKFRVAPIGADTMEDYIMLGPWESDPDRNILSYQAPFAKAFIGKGVKDEVDIDLPMHTGRYIVEAIESLTVDQLHEIGFVDETGILLSEMEDDEVPGLEQEPNESQGSGGMEESSPASDESSPVDEEDSNTTSPTVEDEIPTV